MVTHLFNAMAPFHHRRSGLVGDVLGNHRFWYSLISDKVHCDRGAIAMAYHAYKEGLILVSDLCPLADSPRSVAVFCGSDVHQERGAARTNEGKLAGSIAYLDQGLRELMTITGCSFQEALEFATKKPLLAIQESATVAEQDAVLWNDYTPVAVWISGKRFNRL